MTHLGFTFVIAAALHIELRPLLYSCEFTFPSAWGIFSSHFSCEEGFYICIITFVHIKNKQAKPCLDLKK